MKMIWIIPLMMIILAGAVLGAGTYTFYTEDGQGVSRIYFYDESAGTCTERTNDNNFDLFDDSFAVGDCMYFGWGYDYFYGLRFNVETTISADSYDLVWQYKDGTYKNISVGDDTEEFSRTGNWTVGWTKDEASSWDGTNPCGVAGYWIRVCVAEVTNPTEGGHIGSDNPTDYVWAQPYAVMNVSGADSTYAWDINGDKKVTRTLLDNRTITNGMPLSLQIQSPAGKMLPINFTVMESDADTNDYFVVDWEDADGQERQGRYNITGDGTYYIDHFYRIHNISTSGFNGRLTVKQDRFGCVDDWANSPSEEIGEYVTFNRNCGIFIDAGGTWTHTSQVLISVMGDVSTMYKMNKIRMSNDQIRVQGTLNSGTADGTTGEGLNGGLFVGMQKSSWGAFMNIYGTANLYATAFWANDDGAGPEFETTSDVTLRNTHWFDHNRYRIKTANFDAEDYSLNSCTSNIEFWYGNFDISGLSSSGSSGCLLYHPIGGQSNIYDSKFWSHSSGDNNKNFNVTDCEFNAINGDADEFVYDKHRLQLNIRDYYGNAIKDAVINVYDVNGNLAGGNRTYPVLSDENGYFEGEIVYRIESDSLVDYGNFSINVQKDGYNDVQIDGVAMDRKTAMTITMNRAGIYPNVNSLDEEYR